MFSEKNGNIKALYLIIGIFVIGGFLNFAITPTVTSDTYEDKHIKLEFPLGFHEEEAEPGLKQ
ncbi:MAG: hypothetical protein ABEJ56_04475, partial [Candidatus Nanohaloarchaea archaeon]